MKIETVDDWNAAAGCCCSVPTAILLAPSGGIYGMVWCYNGMWVDGNLYRTQRVTYGGGGSRVYSWDHSCNADMSPTTSPNRIIDGVLTVTEIPPYTGGSTTTYEDLVDFVADLEAGIAATLAYVDTHWESEAWTPASSFLQEPGVTFQVGGGGPMATVYMHRYRWKIPSGLSNQAFRGSYAKITWDIIRIPNPFDYPLDANPDVTFAAEGLTWEWEGPGDASDPDDASWFSDYFDFNEYMTPPWLMTNWASPDGTKRTQFKIVNARWEFFRGSMLGKKPIPFGPTWEPMVP